MIIAFTVLAVLLGVYSFFFLRRGVWFFSFMLVAIYFAGTELLSRAKPAPLEILRNEGKLIAFATQEPNYIFVWVFYDEPRAYRLPWDRKLAGELHKAMKKNKGGTTIKLRDNETRGPVVHPTPIEPLPPKTP